FALGEVPRVDLALAPRIFQTLHTATQRGVIRACHDLSEGGLATALAEMAFAGGLGADVTELRGGTLPDEAMLFSESTTRFMIEVKPENAATVQELFAGLP